MEQLSKYQLTDEQWEKVEEIIDRRIGDWGGSNANDNRLFVEACLYIVGSRTAWYNLPSKYGKYKAVNRRFNRWRNSHIWDEILLILLNDPRFDWLLIDDGEDQEGNQFPVFSMAWMKLISPSNQLMSQLKKRMNEPLSG